VTAEGRRSAIIDDLVDWEYGLVEYCVFYSVSVLNALKIPIFLYIQSHSYVQQTLSLAGS